jgi:DNA polymerase III epsilon subunit-like protein
MSWTEATLHIIDFEGNKTSGILEYGLVTVRGPEILETRTRLCGPIGRIREEDVRTHGIREADVNGEAPFAHEWDLFLGRRKTGFFGAHFASVENSLIRSVWPFPGTVPDFTGGAAGRVDWGPWVDTGRLLPNLFTGLTGAGLADLIEAFGRRDRLEKLAAEHCPEDRRGYHCALYDALASAVLLSVIAEEPTCRHRSLRWLLEMSAGSASRSESLRQRRLF